MRTDIKNERRNNLLMVLFGIAFFIIASCATGQNIKRGVNKAGIVYKYNARPVFFSTNKQKDALVFNIGADSIGYKNYNVYVYCQILGQKSAYDLKIGFPDGHTEILKPFEFDQETGYSKFEVKGQFYDRLKIMKYDYICFETKETLYPCTDIAYPLVFTNFLNNYYK